MKLWETEIPDLRSTSWFFHRQRCSLVQSCFLKAQPAIPVNENNLHTELYRKFLVNGLNNNHSWDNISAYIILVCHGLISQHCSSRICVVVYYLPFSKKGMIICCGLNTTHTEHVSKTTCLISVKSSRMLLQGTESWFLAKCHFLLPQDRNRVAEEGKRITSS